MKKTALIFMLFLNSVVFSQQFNVSKTEVLVDTEKNIWSPTTENVFIESFSLLPGGSIEVTLSNKVTELIYKSEIISKIDKNGNKVMIFSPKLIRGSNSEIEITLIDKIAAFAYGNSVGWEKSNPSKITIFRLWF
jgi:hypothetical protein